jgi:hypothetical protein
MDLNYGFTLIQKAEIPNFDLEFFGFAAPASNTDFPNLLVNELDLFKKFCVYFRHEASKMLKKLYDNPADLGSVKDVGFYNIDPKKIKLPFNFFYFNA